MIPIIESRTISKVLQVEIIISNKTVKIIKRIRVDSVTIIAAFHHLRDNNSNNKEDINLQDQDRHHHIIQIISKTVEVDIHNGVQIVAVDIKLIVEIMDVISQIVAVINGMIRNRINDIIHHVQTASKDHHQIITVELTVVSNCKLI